MDSDDQQKRRHSETDVALLRAFNWSRVSRQMFGRKNPMWESGNTWVVVGFFLGVLSAADFATGMKKGMTTYPLWADILLLSASFLFLFIGLLKLRRFGSGAIWYIAIMGAAFPTIANMAAIVGYLNR